MDSRFLSLQASLDQLVTNAVDRNKTLTIAIADAVSDHLSLPSAPVENALSYFTLQTQLQVNSIVGQFNENIIFNSSHCVEFIKAFWMIRYCAAYPCVRPAWANECSYFDNKFGVNSHLSSDDLAFMNVNKQILVQLSNQVCSLLCELNKV